MANKRRILETILVAIDFSKNSDIAIDRAVKIAKKEKSNITLLHIVQKKSLDNFVDNTLKNLLPQDLWLTTEEYKEELIKEKISSLSRYKLNINYVIIKQGNPGIEILKYARKNKIALLIIGAHGKYSLRNAFVGTTAEYIVKRTKCPVLVVKVFSKNSYKKILCPVDFSNSSKVVLKNCLELFPSTRIRLIHAGDYEYESLLKREERKEYMTKDKLIKMRKAILFYLESKMKKFIKSYCKKLNKNSYDIQLGYPGPIIVSESKKLNYDLIVMGTQSHGRTHYLSIGSVANWVLTETDKDILLIPS